MKGAIATWLALAACLCSGLAQAQTEPDSGAPPHDISTVAVATPGSTLSIPIADERDADPHRYEIPELAGTRIATGPQLVDGHLPRPVADYITRVNSVLQRLSLFENGLVSAHLEGVGGTINKRLIIPDDGMQAIRKYLTPENLRSVPVTFGLNPTAKSYVLLRIYDESGASVERRFDPSSVLPGDLERPRAILQDLLRAVAQDRDVTNSVAGYVPAVGDRLIGEDQKPYQVVSITQDGLYVEMRSLVDPVELYVATKDMQKFFVGKPASSKR